MSQHEHTDWKRHYSETPILITNANTLLWGTVFGGIALAIVYRVTHFLILGPLLNLEILRGEELGKISFGMAFVCSAGYAIYWTYEEMWRRIECKRRGLTLTPKS